MWWHLYDAVLPEGHDWGPSYAQVILGESTKAPNEMPLYVTPGKTDEVNERLLTTFNYVASFDHDPTDQEKLDLTPEEYRDDGE